MFARLSTLLEVVGLALIVTAAAFVSVPLSIAVAGVSLVGLGLAGER